MSTLPGPGLIPDDEWNRELAAQVRPSDWINPAPAGRYDLVVIGAGTAGLVTAAGAAGLGAKVALIERRLLGGDCLNFGCVPSKALLAAARTAATARRSGDYGVDISGDVSVDFPRVMARVRRLRASISRHDSARRFQSLGVDVFLGDAAFTEGGEAVQVGDAVLRYRKAVLCTGGRPAVPSIPGLDAAGYLTNESLFSLTTLPKRLAVIGGGPIGCEMAQAFSRLGSQVRLYQSRSRLLPRDDPEAAALLAASLSRDGVEIFCNARVQEVCRGDGGKTVVAGVGQSTERHECDAILVATGRTANVEGLRLDAAGIACGPDGIRVDDSLRTTNRRVFAAGDVCSDHKFTHAADFQARIVIQNALFFGRAKQSRLLIPWCTYTSPEIAHVGVQPEAGRGDGSETTTLVHRLSQVDRALLDGETDGFVKLHLRRGSDRIVGATVVAPHAGELISEITLAIQQRIGLKAIASVIHPYPTEAEAIRKLGDEYNRGRLTPFVRRLLKFILRWS